MKSWKKETVIYLVQLFIIFLVFFFKMHISEKILLKTGIEKCQLVTLIQQHTQ